jgi:hypothetical protein
MIGRQGLSPSRDPDLHQLPVGVAEGAIAKRTPPESLPFIGICGIDPGFVRSCHGGQVNEASHDVNHRSHCSTRIRFLYTCDQWIRTRSTTALTRTGSWARWLRASSPKRVGAGAWSTRTQSAMGRTAWSRWSGSAGGSSSRAGRRCGPASGTLTSCRGRGVSGQPQP